MSPPISFGAGSWDLTTFEKPERCRKNCDRNRVDSCELED